MEIAPAVIEDAHAIAKVHTQCWQAAYAHIFDPSWLAALSVEDRTARWQRILAANESRSVVARKDGNIVGFVSFGKCRDEGSPADQAELWALYAAPEVWGQGVGRALTSYALASLKEAGFKSTSLWVLTENHRGIAFYESCGFKRVSGGVKRVELGGTQAEEVAYVHRNDA